MSTYQSRKVAHKAKRDKLLGTVCCNCGKDVGAKIEYHHIVPLECGGNDIVSNLAPVCEDCHSIITYGRKRRRPNNGGRKRKVYDPQLADSVFTRYINRQITETQAKQELGTGQHIKEMFIFKEWCEKNGVNPKINYGQSGRWYKIKKARPSRSRDGQKERGTLDVSR